MLFEFFSFSQNCGYTDILVLKEKKKEGTTVVQGIKCLTYWDDESSNLKSEILFCAVDLKKKVLIIT